MPRAAEGAQIRRCARGYPQSRQAWISGVSTDIPLPDFYPSTSRFLHFRRGQADLEHAILEASVCSLDVGALRKRNAAVEGTFASLVPVIPLSLLLPFRSPLTPDGERVVGDVYRHVVLGESGQVRPHHEIVPAAKHVYLWSPHSPVNVQTAHVSREGEVLEQT